MSYRYRESEYEREGRIIHVDRCEFENEFGENEDDLDQSWEIFDATEGVKNAICLTEGGEGFDKKPTEKQVWDFVSDFDKNFSCEVCGLKGYIMDARPDCFFSHGADSQALDSQALDNQVLDSQVLDIQGLVFIERCDACEKYDSDGSAAKSFAHCSDSIGVELSQNYKEYTCAHGGSHIAFRRISQ